MGWGDNTYSRLVGLMKILLPTVGLGLLSTLFLCSEGFAPGSGSEIAIGDARRGAAQPGATNATISGMTPEGSEISLSTRTIRPMSGRPGNFSASGISARLALASGGDVEIAAERATFDRNEGAASFTGNVGFSADGPYRLESDSMFLRLDPLVVESPGPVRGETPNGRIFAGSMRLRRDGTGSELHFADGIKLLYRP